ncbi:MAG: DUF1501 domain-containing protein [Planctomycetes bacterium]|nr:DUF1501 domain-containing protein [Planctomycetota bacterium]
MWTETEPSSPLAQPPFALNRRAFLGTYAGGLGAFALAHLLGLDAARAAPPAASGEAAASSRRGLLEPKPPHFAPRARAVICLFQHGGPSQVDLFDPKPELSRHGGKPYEGDLEVHFHKQRGNLLASPFKFQRCGASGLELSEVLPWTGKIADDLTLVRSMRTDSVDHEAALRCMHAGKVFGGRPAWGAWVVYALGTERQDLPAYVVLSDPGGLPVDGIRNWSSGFLPAMVQGTQIRSGKTPVFNLDAPEGLPEAARARQLRFLRGLNELHLHGREGNTELEARIANYEMAARMQLSVTEALDVSREDAETRRLYGLETQRAAEYGKRCLMARRLVERGVRFVQVFLSSQPWDTHDKNAETLKGLCAMTDQPSAALVMDLKRRGLLDSTIVLWTGEFGRLPVSQGKDGRDHNRHAFSLWLAGGGFRGGHAHGGTDDFGYRSVEDVVHVSDLHATLLHALGLDHRRLTHDHEGREDSLTDPAVSGAKVVRELLA